MSDESVNPLIVELLNWISTRPRTYAETMEAWRSNCPRHFPWEDALIEGLIELESNANDAKVYVSARGRAILKSAESRPD
jgi:hypothetical protein